MSILLSLKCIPRSAFIRGGSSWNYVRVASNRNCLFITIFVKGGAGGKGTWGKFGDEMDLPWVDPRDPNYDSDHEEAAEVAPGAGGNKTIKLNTMVPEMSEEDIRKAVEPLVLEYFENGDCDEVLFSLEEMLLNIGARRWMIPALAIELSMDHKPSHREMTSQLISELYQKVERYANVQLSNLHFDSRSLASGTLERLSISL